MHPFTIATGTMEFAQNTFIRIHTDTGLKGVGECSAFPMIVGETQNTCFEMAKDFARLWKRKNPTQILDRMQHILYPGSRSSSHCRRRNWRICLEGPDTGRSRLVH